MTTKVRIREGCRHIVPDTEVVQVQVKDEAGNTVLEDKTQPRPGGRIVEAGEEIMVTDAELAAYPDKFIVLDTPRRGRPPKAD